MKDLRTIILAAGKGTRMKSYTPKVLHAVGGKALLSYVLDVARDVGSLKTCVVVGHQGDVVRRFLDKGIVAVTQKRLLGTADAIRSCTNFLKGFRGDVLILCVDTPLLRRETVKQLLVSHRKTKSTATVLTARVSNPFGYGRVIRNDEGRPVAIREENDASDAEKEIDEINVGVYCFDSRALAAALKKIKINSRKKEFYLTDIFAILAQGSFITAAVEARDANEGLGVNTRV